MKRKGGGFVYTPAAGWLSPRGGRGVGALRSPIHPYIRRHPPPSLYRPAHTLLSIHQPTIKAHALSMADEKAPREAFGLSGGHAHQQLDGEQEDDHHGGRESGIKSKLSGLLWHGGSTYDAWFSCASNQVSVVALLASSCSRSVGAY
jgi:hypothetical protein